MYHDHHGHKHVQLVDKKTPALNKQIFDAATKWLHKNKGFEAANLADEAPLALVNEINRVLEGAVKSGLSTGIKHEVPEALTRALNQNVFVFSGLKTYHELKQASLLLQDEKGGIKPYNQFQQEMVKLHESYNVNYLNAEYNFATSASQMAAKWNDIEQDGDEYDLQFRTAADEKVRASHAILHNTTLPPSDLFWSEYIPPLDWNCRCTVVQVLKGKYPLSVSAEAVGKGQQATTRLGKDGVNRVAMFRFNPGKQRVIFPEKHPYFKVQQRIREVVEALSAQGEWEEIPVKKGSIKVSPLHGKKERKDNIRLASFYANKYGYDYKLLPINVKHRTADALNETLGIKQELKINTTPTKSAIDNALRSAKGQSANIVIEINSSISTGDLADVIKNRVNRSPKIEEVWLRKGDVDRKYGRDEILGEGFKIQWD